MARFMVTRTLPPLTEDELTEVGKRVVEVCNEMDGVEWLVQLRKTFCATSLLKTLFPAKPAAML